VQSPSSTRSSLEYGTKLDDPSVGSWGFTLYPDAAEGGGSFRSATKPGRARWEPIDPPADNQADAIRRARGKVRRYCAANGLNRLGTLTYAGSGCHDPARLRGDVAGFFRRLRRSLDERLPYLWVPEWHKSGHGLHVHFAVGQFVGQRLIADAWGHGFVHIKLLGDLPTGSGVLGEARLASRYLSKYIGKDLGDAAAGGLHRYEVAQGFQPRSVSLDGTTAEGVLGWAESVMDRPAAYLWRSRDQKEWAGPPALWASWV
jgi:hypothetical protein